jgi:maltooligosyltrehalose trehalohydrolase
MGAEVVADGVRFGVWAPRAAAVTVVIESGGEHALAATGDGFFSACVATARAGDRYCYRIDDGTPLPDPASRFQPDGPHGPSEVVDPRAFAWQDEAWRGIPAGREVLYELHVGTFTPEGTWAAAQRLLPMLAELGITLVEVMPVADFPGAFGWGYDGVNAFAPYHGYGDPDAMRRFVDAAHALGVGVVVDVVYNHFGPDGNYLRAFTPDWIGRHKSEWGDGPNYDGPGNDPVREFYAANAAYWIDEFHADGLRFDAVHQVLDTSAEHVLRPIVRAARAAAGQRNIFIVAEDEAQEADMLRAAPAGVGFDAAWNDDFHHAVTVALSGRNDAYYADYQGSAQEIVSACKYGYLFQGQHSARFGRAHGSAAGDVRPGAFVHYLENHDQVANSVRGERLAAIAAPGALRAATALLLLLPATPLIFQGQEYGSTRPFLYYADHQPELAAAVRQGRAAYLRMYASTAEEAVRRALADPGSADTFVASKLDPAERDSARGQRLLALHRDLLRLRRDDPVIAGRNCRGIDGAVLGADVFVIRLIANDGDDRLLLVNFGRDLKRATIAEPLLAPPADTRWRVAWSSEDVAYGGSGAYPLEADRWHITGHSAALLMPALV